jgi:hypothetical protein
MHDSSVVCFRWRAWWVTKQLHTTSASGSREMMSSHSLSKVRPWTTTGLAVIKQNPWGRCQRGRVYLPQERHRSRPLHPGSLVSSTPVEIAGWKERVAIDESSENFGAWT